MPAPTLRADRVRFARGRRLIIDDVDCTVPGGTVGALLGPNGAGKSTLLHLIAGVERADAGTARLGDRDLAALRRRDRARVLALAEQEVHDAPGLRVAEVVALGRTPYLGRVRGPGRPRPRGRAPEPRGPRPRRARRPRVRHALGRRAPAREPRACARTGARAAAARRADQPPRRARAAHDARTPPRARARWAHRARGPARPVPRGGLCRPRHRARERTGAGCRRLRPTCSRPH